MRKDDFFNTSVIDSLRAYAVRTVLGYRLPAETGEDIAQDVVVQLLENDELLAGIRQLAFVRTMIRHRALDAVRSQRRCHMEPLDGWKELPVEDVRAEVSINQQSLASHLWPKVQKALAMLKGKRRLAMEIFTQKSLQSDGEVPFRVIADEVGTSIATVSRARVELQRALFEIGIEELPV